MKKKIISIILLVITIFIFKINTIMAVDIPKPTKNDVTVKNSQLCTYIWSTNIYDNDWSANGASEETLIKGIEGQSLNPGDCVTNIYRSCFGDQYTNVNDTIIKKSYIQLAEENNKFVLLALYNAYSQIEDVWEAHGAYTNYEDCTKDDQLWNAMDKYDEFGFMNGDNNQSDMMRRFCEVYAQKENYCKILRAAISYKATVQGHDAKNALERYGIENYSDLLDTQNGIINNRS